MHEVVGVSLKEKGKIYYFLPGKYKLKKKITVIVETERGLQFGKVETETIKIPDNKIKGPLKKVIRIATKEDYNQHQKNIKESKEALKKCRKIVEDKKLNMQIIDATYTFDRSQLLFRFLSDNRVDFRELAKDLAHIYKTRIELRQVGARDKAKEIGGCGMCGKKLCCSQFLEDLESVSINMAKNQNLSLNPSKINGVCGRLLCCLKYEDDCYSECRRCLPDIGKKVKTDEGTGKVVSLNILKKSYTVEIPDIGNIEVECKDESN